MAGRQKHSRSSRIDKSTIKSIQRISGSHSSTSSDIGPRPCRVLRPRLHATGPGHQYGANGAPHAAVCAGRTLAPNNAFYCPDSDSIHWHGPWVVALYQAYGDFAASYVWAHEYSHAMQRRAGLLAAGRFSIQRELEADCFAGAWASWAEKVVKILEPGDIDEALRVMFDVRDRSGTPSFDPNAHGTAQARIRSFNLGYDNGTPKACVGR